jgi:hypothetical protein
VPVYVAAMGPKALQVSGGLADRTLPYLAGPRTMAEVRPAGHREVGRRLGTAQTQDYRVGASSYIRQR